MKPPVMGVGAVARPMDGTIKKRGSSVFAPLRQQEDVGILGQISNW
jgi:hypothetical protein